MIEAKVGVTFCFSFSLYSSQRIFGFILLFLVPPFAHIVAGYGIKSWVVTASPKQ